MVSFLSMPKSVVWMPSKYWHRQVSTELAHFDDEGIHFVNLKWDKVEPDVYYRPFVRYPNYPLSPLGNPYRIGDMEGFEYYIGKWKDGSKRSAAALWVDAMSASICNEIWCTTDDYDYLYVMFGLLGRCDSPQFLGRFNPEHPFAKYCFWHLRRFKI